ncbi:MAG: hypothetical protein SWH61_08160 [Thermodesulfobacteriota bacterium]|nr:hypothetical protein [Thermodesulfobacteriota bacterium]
MTREDKGHFKQKHPDNTTYDPLIADAVTAKADNGCISCASAFTVAGDLSTTPAEVGKTMDLLEIRLVRCQLGLFGYPENKIVKPAADVSSALKELIHAKAENGRLSCDACWRIAEQQQIPRMQVSAACETLSIKLKPCQLGAF